MKSFNNKIYRLIILILFLIFLAVSPLANAQSLGQDDASSIYNDTVWYKPSSGVAASCSIGNATPGDGAPDGAKFPKLDPSAMAAAINQWILKENPKSTLSGMGDVIVTSSKNSNVSPFLIVAIAAEESSVGDPGVTNVQIGNNAFGRTATNSQPHFIIGSRVWYKWTSIKASVDYSAPENQNAAGGGDMPAYLRNQYTADIDSGNLLSLFLKYAPAGDGNDPVAYAAKVTSWINDMVQLSGQSGSASIGALGGCGVGIFAGDIVKTATGLAWPNGFHGPDKSDATPAYQDALPSYNTATLDYSDCGGFVATVMHASGADTNYVGVYVPNQYDYVSKTANTKYQIIKNVRDSSQLQPGDILMYLNANNPGDSHTFIYVGSQPGFDGDGAAASLGGHVPEAVSAAASFAYNGRAASGNYFAVRLIK